MRGLFRIEDLPVELGQQLIAAVDSEWATEHSAVSGLVKKSDSGNPAQDYGNSFRDDRQFSFRGSITVIEVFRFA